MRGCSQNDTTQVRTWLSVVSTQRSEQPSLLYHGGSSSHFTSSTPSRHSQFWNERHQDVSWGGPRGQYSDTQYHAGETDATSWHQTPRFDADARTSLALRIHQETFQPVACARWPVAGTCSSFVPYLEYLLPFVIQSRCRPAGPLYRTQDSDKSMKTTQVTHTRAPRNPTNIAVQFMTLHRSE